jgi:hypothetical protein
MSDQQITHKKLDPNNPEERKELIRQAVQRTVKEYGEALKKLASH